MSLGQIGEHQPRRGGVSAGDHLTASRCRRTQQRGAGVFGLALHQLSPGAEFGAEGRSESTVCGSRAHDDEHFRLRRDLCRHVFGRVRILRVVAGPRHDAEEDAEQQQRDEHARTSKLMADENKKTAHAERTIMRDRRTQFKAGDVRD